MHTRRQHQRSQTAAGANIQRPARTDDGRLGAEQHAIGAHFHRTPIVGDKKLFKGKSVPQPRFIDGHLYHVHRAPAGVCVYFKINRRAQTDEDCVGSVYNLRPNQR